MLSKVIMDEMKKERKVMAGEAERKEIFDPKFAHLESEKSMLDESESEKTEDGEIIDQIITYFPIQFCNLTDLLEEVCDRF